MSVFRAEIQLAKGAAWQFVAECPTSEDAWKAVGAFARDYYAAQVIYPTSGTASQLSVLPPNHPSGKRF